VHGIDWPLAITLALVFVVMSIVRWRYFRSLARRRAKRAEMSATEDRVDPPAP
jgi:membrane protein implicated in regulation of membrane protease activity